MDLRNRDSYQEIVKGLLEVPCERYAQLAHAIAEIVAREGVLEKESALLMNSLEAKSAKARLAQVGRAQGILRVHVFSSIEARTNSYSMRISGDCQGSENSTFSDFVSRVDIKLPSGEVVAWTRSVDDASKIDGITLSRSVDASTSPNSEIEIQIHVNYRNCLYAVPSSLSNHPSAYMSFVQLFRCICAYIKSHNLSSNDDPSYFTPDKVLHEILYPNHPRQLPVSFASLLEATRAHFKPPGPFKIKHKTGSQEQIFDLFVQLVDNIDNKVSVVLAEAEKKLSDKLNELDKDIADITEGLEQVALDAKFLDKLSANPAQYLQQVLETPTGTKREVQSAGHIDYMQMATSYEFYKQPWAVAAAAYVVSEQKKQAGA